jgi:acyl-CoA dehydrogenase
MKRLIDFAKTKNDAGAAPWDEPLLRAKIVELQAELDALEYSVMRAILADDHGASDLASLVKIPGSEMRQRVSELMVEALSTYGVTFYPPYYDEKDRDALPGPIEARGVSGMFAYRRATTIYGGANEVQRDIISKAILRL